MARRTALEAANTRAEILRSARKLFAQAGFAAASTAEIARQAGVTEGAVFHHFGTKKALFAEVLGVLEGELTAEAVRVGAGDPPEAAFLLACRAALEHARRPDYQRIVMLDGPNVLGDAEWRKLDSGFGLGAVRAGLRRIAPERSRDQDLSMLAVAVLGILNETAFALARQERGVNIESCIALVGALIAARMNGDIR